MDFMAQSVKDSVKGCNDIPAQKKHSYTGPGEVWLLRYEAELSLIQVEYEVESCSAATGVTNDGCIDTKSVSLTMPTGGTVIYGVGHQHTGGIGITLYGEKMASSSRGLLTLFPDLNESTGERTGAVASEPQPNTAGFAPLNFPMRSVEQKMAVQTDVEANQYTLKACVESMTAVTNLSHRLQSRTNEVHQLNSQLALLQRMYKDARAEISVLRAENKELKRKATVMFRFGGPPYAAVEEQGVVIVPSGVGNTEATPSRAAQDGGKKKRPAAE
ncbi:hypothetical protein HYC85_028833 [Camellia sinensis]|uniref:Uncharacterized protein n=1 Tax=Camellia sinensis TaxID=4442 RepID=A0A7J7FWD8_CAMSI|nr:hypothetical protein HYC85_028833 [Camellia sinensis]